MSPVAANDNIRGTVLLRFPDLKVCKGLPYSRVHLARLEKGNESHQHAYPFRHLKYEGAGHLILVPGGHEPRARSGCKLRECPLVCSVRVAHRRLTPRPASMHGEVSWNFLRLVSKVVDIPVL
jgi:hypothetical protein